MAVKSCYYDHLQLFVDSLKPMTHYKAIEARLNKFAKLAPIAKGARRHDLAAGRKAWCELGDAADPTTFQVHGRDLVEQLLFGFGWRITAEHVGPETRSVLLSTVDQAGIKFVVTCKADAGAAEAYPAKRAKTCEEHDHFAAAHLERFHDYHNGAQGVGVLGFELSAGELDGVAQRYSELHPKLLVAPAPHAYAGGVRVLDVFAYYRGEKGVTDADPGTIIRFVERPPTLSDGSTPAPGLTVPLPGLVAVPAEFDSGGVLPAYADHWVSNVRSRVGFLQTLHETLGFTPKVDFNAGVVAAGEAQIESTVMGNASALVTTDPHQALVDRGQVFLPTNNALSPVGHVHWYLEELGQGIQHVASRVSSLPDYVQRANDYRAMTGEGFTFLNIPRTYYGLLEPPLLMRGGTERGELLGECAAADCPAEDEAAEVIAALVRAAAASIRPPAGAGLCDATGAVELEADAPAFAAALAQHSRVYRDAPAAVRAMLVRVVCRSRYVNLWRLMRDQLPEATYLTVVRNKILIDVQGEDVLMQIFTSVVLQRAPATEAPFLEFIQRVCAQCGEGAAECKPIKPGCGGFGSRPRGRRSAAQRAQLAMEPTMEPMMEPGPLRGHPAAWRLPALARRGALPPRAGIRNFLTLFLSIEVSKAMLDRKTAEGQGAAGAAEAAHHERRVRLFTEQLVESNPILTEISDCMTAEGAANERGDAPAAQEWAAKKAAANAKLQQCSQKYNEAMKALREAGWE